MTKNTNPETIGGILQEDSGVNFITGRPGANDKLPPSTGHFVPVTEQSNRAIGLASRRTRSGQQRPTAGAPLGADK